MPAYAGMTAIFKNWRILQNFIESIAKEFEVQLVNYLTATVKLVGLVLNFTPHKVEVKTKVSILPDRA